MVSSAEYVAKVAARKVFPDLLLGSVARTAFFVALSLEFQQWRVLLVGGFLEGPYDRD